MATQFLEDCKKAVTELNGLIKHLEDQDKLIKILDEMNLNEKQKEIFAKYFLSED